MISKNVGSLISFVANIGIVVMAVACQEPTVAEETRELLTASTWHVRAVEMGGSDKTDFFAGMKLDFQDHLYKAENGGLMWGTDLTLSWSFKDEEAKQFAIGSGPLVHIQELSKSRLKLRVWWDLKEYGAGVSSPETGLYIFEFGK